MVPILSQQLLITVQLVNYRQRDFAQATRYKNMKSYIIYWHTILMNEDDDYYSGIIL